MEVIFTIDLLDKVKRIQQSQMKELARQFTDDKKSIKIDLFADDPKKVAVRFTVPDGNQMHVVDEISRPFRMVEGYNRSGICFERKRPSRRKR